MAPFDQVSLALTIMRRLQQAVTHETAVLRRMHLGQLAELQAEKAALTDSYERQVRALRARPEVVAALELPVREAFEQASRELQTAIAANVRALETARTIVEGVVRTLGRSLDPAQERAGYVPAGRPGIRGSAPVPLALNREI